MKNVRSACFLVCLSLVFFLNSCETADKIINYSPEPDYFTSRSRKVVEHRSRNSVEYYPGQVYRNTRTMYFVDGMTGKNVTDAYWDGKILKTLPQGTRFTVSRVRAVFTLSGNEVVPTFSVSGLPGNEISVGNFATSDRESSGKIRYMYNREYFRREK